jgi:hypothetical protein
MVGEGGGNRFLESLSGGLLQLRGRLARNTGKRRIVKGGDAREEPLLGPIVSFPLTPLIRRRRSDLSHQDASIPESLQRLGGNRWE